MRALYRQLRERRKHARTIGVGLSVALLLLACFVFIVLKSLPSTSDLRSRYFSSRLRKPILVGQAAAGETQSGTTISASSSAAVATVPTATPTPPPAPSTTLADYAVTRFVDRGERTLRVCESVQNLRTPPPVDEGSFSRAINDEIQTGGNAFADAALAPVGALLRLPNVGAVAQGLRNSEDDLSIVREAQFYSSVALAAGDVYRNKSSLDQVSAHAYHLSIMARLASIAPASATDTLFQNLCAAMEARALDPASASAQDTDSEKAALIQLIAAQGLTPQQVGYNPQLNTQLDVSVTTTSVMVTSPWMSEMFGAGLQLQAGH